jgi:hypothetical protein
MGNHDPDLFWPKVKAEIYKLLKPPKQQQLEFVQTFVRRGSAHIEHGNQHCSPENKFQNPEKVFHLCDTDNQEHLEMVWGSIFVMEFFNSIEYTHPYADKIKPTLNALWLGIKNGWINSEVVGMFVKFLKGAGIPWRSLAELLSDQERSPTELIQSIEDKRIARQLLEIYARDPKLKSSVDEEIARTTEAEWKSINSLNNDPLVTLDELTPLVDEPSPTLGIFRESAEFRGARSLLQQPGVQHVIFGHTHTEIDGADSNAPVKNYFNTGTWIRRLDLKNKENRELLRNITQDDLKKDELFELRLMTAVIEVADENYTHVSLQQLRM